MLIDRVKSTKVANKDLCMRFYNKNNWNFLCLLHVRQHNIPKIEKILNLTAIHFTIFH